MKYLVEGGIAHFGTNMILGLSDEQVAARAHVLEEVEGGYRPTAPIQFKAGELVEIPGDPDKLPRPLAAVLVPQGDKKTVSQAHQGRKRTGTKSSASDAPAS
ncbi:hypothetical protein [Aminobacter aminovorans]|uniref:hypothetical protein n=1 Tax=Aminobacter aminovorans TaxID=83263 RepID=UPI00285D6700|nr:hypothetical protein [Aminobacter aminovorans]MDR7220353.1 hypothetical protein [Aminobacter aminovorans]